MRSQFQTLLSRLTYMQCIITALCIMYFTANPFREVTCQVKKNCMEQTGAPTNTGHVETTVCFHLYIIATRVSCVNGADLKTSRIIKKSVF